MYRKKIDSISDKKINKKFTWEMFYNCNYNCSYCFQEHCNLNVIDINKLKETSLKIKEFIIKNKINNLTLMGGEISILKLKDLLFILNVFRKLDIDIEFFSNFSAKNSYYLNVINFLKNETIVFFFSFHYEKVSEKEFFEKLEDLLKKIPKNRNVEIFISVVLDDYMFERYETLYTYFEVLKKTYGDLINLRITERLFSKDKKTFKSYDFFKFLTKYPEAVMFFDNYQKKVITFKNGESIYEREPKGFKTCGYKCLTAHFRLGPENTLTTVCCYNIIAQDFLKYNIDMGYPEYFVCKQKKCFGAYRKIVLEDKQND